MSTIDSYSLVAGANVSYDIYRPLWKPNATDADLVKMTRIGVVVSWGLGYMLAFTFERLMALWVFNATLLTSTVLIPIFAALFWKGKKTPAAGFVSCLVGMVSVIGYYVGVQVFGVHNEQWGTYIWTFQVAGIDFSLWQEYSLFFSLPMSLLGFLIGNLFGQPYEPTRERAAIPDMTA